MSTFALGCTLGLKKFGLQKFKEFGLCSADRPFEDFEFSLELPIECVNVVWKRPTEIVENPQFMSGAPNKLALNLNRDVPNHWHLAALGALTNCPTVMDRVIPSGQSCDAKKSLGIFRFNFWRYGKWEEVVIDDRLPFDDVEKRLVFCHNDANPKEMWSALCEKAYAKFRGGSYKALDNGSPSEAFMELSGGMHENVVIDHTDKFRRDLLWKRMTVDLKNLCGKAGVPKVLSLRANYTFQVPSPPEDGMKVLDSIPLYFTITGTKENNEGEQWVRLRTPYINDLECQTKIPCSIEESTSADESDVEASSGLTDLTPTTFDNHIREGIHFVMFFSEQCPRCHALQPTWHQLANEFEQDDDVFIDRINTRIYKKIGWRYDVFAWPTLILFIDGEEAERYSGYRSFSALRDLVNQAKRKYAGDEEENGCSAIGNTWSIVNPTYESGASFEFKIEKDGDAWVAFDDVLLHFHHIIFGHLTTHATKLSQKYSLEGMDGPLYEDVCNGVFLENTMTSQAIFSLDIPNSSFVVDLENDDIGYFPAYVSVRRKDVNPDGTRKEFDLRLIIGKRTQIFFDCEDFREFLIPQKSGVFDVYLESGTYGEYSVRVLSCVPFKMDSDSSLTWPGIFPPGSHLPDPDPEIEFDWTKDEGDEQFWATQEHFAVEDEAGESGYVNAHGLVDVLNHAISRTKVDENQPFGVEARKLSWSTCAALVDCYSAPNAKKRLNWRQTLECWRSIKQYLLLCLEQRTEGHGLQIPIEKLETLLARLGFSQVGWRVVVALASVYMNKSRELYFDQFVACVVKLFQLTRKWFDLYAESPTEPSWQHGAFDKYLLKEITGE